MLALAKIGRFFLEESFPWEANFQRSLLLFEHEQLHDGHGSNLKDEFGMRDVKGKDNNILRSSHGRSPVLSLRRIDPYWRSQLLVEYSKDLGACMILDYPDRDDRYMVDDMVIYSYGKVFLTRASKLKEKLLHSAHEDFFSMHFDAYLFLAEEFIWEGIQHDIF